MKILFLSLLLISQSSFAKSVLIVNKDSLNKQDVVDAIRVTKKEDQRLYFKICRYIVDSELDECSGTIGRKEGYSEDDLNVIKDNLNEANNNDFLVNMAIIAGGTITVGGGGHLTIRHVLGTTVPNVRRKVMNMETRLRKLEKRREATAPQVDLARKNFYEAQDKLLKIESKASDLNKGYYRFTTFYYGAGFSLGVIAGATKMLFIDDKRELIDLVKDMETHGSFGRESRRPFFTDYDIDDMINDLSRALSYAAD